MCSERPRGNRKGGRWVVGCRRPFPERSPVTDPEQMPPCPPGLVYVGDDMPGIARGRRGAGSSISTRRAGPSLRRSASASSGSGSRRPGRRSGSAPIRRGTCRRPASMPPGESSTATIRTGAPGARRRSTGASRPSARRWPASGRGSSATCRAKRATSTSAWPRSRCCSTGCTSGSGRPLHRAEPHLRRDHAAAASPDARRRRAQAPLPGQGRQARRAHAAGPAATPDLRGDRRPARAAALHLDRAGGRGAHHRLAPRQRLPRRAGRGRGVSAKTFRTWAGTMAAFRAARRAKGKLAIRELSEAAAAALHNTPTIARSSYIHPAVLDLAALPAEERRALLRRAPARGAVAAAGGRAAAAPAAAGLCAGPGDRAGAGFGVAEVARPGRRIAEPEPAASALGGHGAADVLERLPEALARHLPGARWSRRGPPARPCSFHTINRKTGNRVESRYVDAETGKPVDEEDQAKGYQIDDDSFVILEDEELEAVALESTRTIDIERFVPTRRRRLALARPAALPDARRQGRRGGLRGDPRGDDGDRDGGAVAAGALPARACGGAGAARTAASCSGRCAMATRCGRRRTTSRTRRGRGEADPAGRPS